MGTNPYYHNTVSDPGRRKLHSKNCILTEDLKSEDCIKAPPSCRHQVAPVDLYPQHQKFHTKSRSAPNHRSLEPVKDSVWCHRHSLGCLSSVWLSGWISYKRCSLGCLSGASPWHGAQWERGNVNPQPSHHFRPILVIVVTAFVKRLGNEKRIRSNFRFTRIRISGLKSLPSLP